jgi:hypothetical protein
MLPTPILVYVAFGAVFGLLTFSRRHLFSEGPTRRASVESDPLDGRVMWVLICACLWPVQVLSGLYAFWRTTGSRRR